MASQAATGCSSPSGVPGRGFRKLSGTSVGSRSCSWSEELDPLRVGLAHPDEGAAAQLHAVVAHQPAGGLALLPAVGGDHLREERPRRLEVVVVAVDAALGEAPGLVVGQEPGADGHVEPGPLPDQGHQLEDPGHGALVRARARPGRCRTPMAPAALVSSAARSTSSVSRKGVALTGVSNRDDWEQKWQSSGQPPVLADRIPSTSTSGPHQASRTWWARAAREVTHWSGSSASAAELLAGQQAALVEEGGLGRRQAGPGRRRVDLRAHGLGRPAGPGWARRG